jgi:hypothetical protein
MPMTFDEKTKAWLMLITLVVGTGATVTITTYLGGAKLWVSVLAGLGTGASNVYHALNDSPKDKQP